MKSIRALTFGQLWQVGRRHRSPGRPGSRDLTPRRIGPRLPGDFSGGGDDVSVTHSGMGRVAAELKIVNESR